VEDKLSKLEKKVLKNRARYIAPSLIGYMIATAIGTWAFIRYGILGHAYGDLLWVGEISLTIVYVIIGSITAFTVMHFFDKESKRSSLIYLL
jgi:fatty acid desaturase